MNITLKIAGTKYYPVESPAFGTPLTLQQDPENKYDSNAIKVLDPEGEQLGHVPAAAAAVITLVMTGNSLLINELFHAKMLEGENFSLEIAPTI